VRAHSTSHYIGLVGFYQARFGEASISIKPMNPTPPWSLSRHSGSLAALGGGYRQAVGQTEEAPYCNGVPHLSKAHIHCRMRSGGAGSWHECGASHQGAGVRENFYRIWTTSHGRLSMKEQA
jgi:hypothetical protein